MSLRALYVLTTILTLRCLISHTFLRVSRIILTEDKQLSHTCSRDRVVMRTLLDTKVQLKLEVFNG